MQIFPQTNYIQCSNGRESYRMFYTAWGVQTVGCKTMVCVHGLNRNGRDWDFVGRHFASLGYYVVAVDIVGRGNSDYLKDPVAYDVQFYVADILNLINTLNLGQIDYVGTSMGGLIGMAIAALPAHPIKKLVLNDIGPEIEISGLKRIASYTNNQPDFKTYAEARAYLMQIASNDGNLPDDIWDFYTLTSFQKNANGNYELKRDVNISKPFVSNNVGDKNLDLWSYWENVNIDVLVIHGAISDLLSERTILKMQEINPKTQKVNIPGVGHAPYLYSDYHMQLLQDFFV